MKNQRSEQRQSTIIVDTGYIARLGLQLFRVRLSNERGKAHAAMSKVIVGNGGCLIEPQGVSAWWKETAETRIYVFSFLVAESP